MDKKVLNIDQSIEDIKKAQIAIGHERFEESTLLLGPSGSGKSTSLAVLYNKCQMEGKYNSDTKDLFIIGHNLPKGMIIEPKAQSGTTFPAKLSIEGKVMFDTPGFGDNKGAQQDLVNAFYLKRLIDVSKKIKIIFVTRFSHMEANADVFLKSLKLFCAAFCDNPHFHESVAILITDTPLDIDSINIKNKIQKNILDAKELELDNDTKSILKHFVNNSNKIITMKKPEINYDLKNYYANFREEFMNVTNKLKSFSVKKPNLILSEDTFNKLPNILNTRSIELENLVKKAHGIIRDFIQNKLKAVEFDPTLNQSLTGVRKSKDLLNAFESAKRNKDVEELYQVYLDYELNLKDVEEVKNIFDCAKLFSEINPIINLNTYKDKIFNLNDDIKNFYRNLEVALQGKFCQYSKEKFHEWNKEFQENSQLLQLEKNIKGIINLIVESYKEKNFYSFFSKLNSYMNLTNKIGMKNIDYVINMIKTFTDVVEEGNVTNDLKNIQNELINGYTTKFDFLNNHLKNRNTFIINNNDIRFNFRSVYDPYDNKIYQNGNPIDINQPNNQENFLQDRCKSLNREIDLLKKQIEDSLEMIDNNKKDIEDAKKRITNLEKEKREITSANNIKFENLPNISIPNYDSDQKKRCSNNKNCCNIFTIKDIKYDNYLLNYPFLQKQILKEYGLKGLNSIIDLNLTADELRDVFYYEMFSDVLGFEKKD